MARANVSISSADGRDACGVRAMLRLTAAMLTTVGPTFSATVTTACE